MKQTSLSEGITMLSRPLQGPGICVHRNGETGKSLCLYVIPAMNIENMEENINDECVVYAYIYVGNSNIVLRKTIHQNTNVLLENMWLQPYEEVWISISQPNKYAVYGLCK